MRVVKSFRVSLMQRVLTVHGAHQLCLGAMVYFPLSAPDLPLPEISMWKQVVGEIGADAPLDEGWPKPRGEALLFGRAFAPEHERPAFSARLQCAAIDKTIYVVGARRWDRGAPTPPEPIRAMQLSWENAFGGGEYAQNPRGMGLSAVEEDGGKVHRLPHLEDPAHLLKSPGDRPAPAGFGALDATLRQRIALMGSYDKAWLERDFPGFAGDLNPEYFQVAPVDQRLALGYFAGGERFVLENVHPTHRRIEGELTSLRPRCFIVQHIGNAEGPLTEVAMRFETVIFLPNLERAVAIFRGVHRIVEDDAGDVAVLLAGLERAGAPKTREHYETVLAKRRHPKEGALHTLREKDLLPERPADAPAFPDEVISDMNELLKREHVIERRSRTRAQAELDKARLGMRLVGMDPDAAGVPKEVPPQEKPPALDEMAEFFTAAMKDVERVQAEAEVKRRDAEAEVRRICTEQGIDYDELLKKAKTEGGGPPKFRADAELARYRELTDLARRGGSPLEDLEAKLEDPAFAADLRRLEDAQFFGYRFAAHHLPPAGQRDDEDASAARADVERAIAAGKSLARRDLTGLDLRGVRLANADLQEALLEGVDLTSADLSAANLRGAVLARAKLGGARLSRADLSGANLGHADVRGADFDGAVLEKTVFYRAELDGATFADAKLSSADFMEARVAGADFRDATVEGVIFFEQDLTGARFGRATLTKSIFFECTGTDLDYGGATLERVCFCRLSGSRISFKGARAPKLHFVSSCALADSDFSGADLSGANFRGADLRGATFAGARAPGADFSGANLRGATFTEVTAPGAAFIRTDLEGADLSRSNLMDALFQKAALSKAVFAGANLFRAVMLDAKGDPETSFAGAHVNRVIMPRKRE